MACLMCCMLNVLVHKKMAVAEVSGHRHSEDGSNGSFLGLKRAKSAIDIQGRYASNTKVEWDTLASTGSTGERGRSWRKRVRD